MPQYFKCFGKSGKPLNQFTLKINLTMSNNKANQKQPHRYINAEKLNTIITTQISKSRLWC